MHQFKVNGLNSVHLICNSYFNYWFKHWNRNCKLSVSYSNHLPWTDAFLSLLLLVYTVFFMIVTLIPILLVKFFYFFVLSISSFFHVPQLYQLSSVKKALCCQLCSTHYTAVQINNRFCNQSSHYENYRRFQLQMETITCLPQNRHFCGEQRWMGHKGGHWLIKWRQHCMNSDAQKAPLRLKWCQKSL